MKHKKILKKLETRQKAFDRMGSKQGYKRPGSMKSKSR